MDYTVHGILQVRILEWVAFPFSRGSFQPRDWTQVSHIAGRFFTSWTTREAHDTSRWVPKGWIVKDLFLLNREDHYRSDYWSKIYLSSKGLRNWCIGSDFFNLMVLCVEKKQKLVTIFLLDDSWNTTLLTPLHINKINYYWAYEKESLSWSLGKNFPKLSKRAQYSRKYHIFLFEYSLLPGRTSRKESTCQCRRLKRLGFNPWIGKIPGGGHGNPLQYSCLENSMDRGAWWATVHGVAKIQTQLSS